MAEPKARTLIQQPGFFDKGLKWGVKISMKKVASARVSTSLTIYCLQEIYKTILQTNSKVSNISLPKTKSEQRRLIHKL